MEPYFEGDFDAVFDVPAPALAPSSSALAPSGVSQGSQPVLMPPQAPPPMPMPPSRQLVSRPGPSRPAPSRPGPSRPGPMPPGGIFAQGVPGMGNDPDGLGAPVEIPTAHMLGASVILPAAGAVIGMKYGGMYGGLGGSILAGSLVNAYRALKNYSQGTDEGDKEALISGTYAVLGFAGSGYLLYKGVTGGGKVQVTQTSGDEDDEDEEDEVKVHKPKHVPKRTKYGALVVANRKQLRGLK